MAAWSSRPGTESLVNEKVGVFRKWVDGRVNKSGQIIVTFSEMPKKTTKFQGYAVSPSRPSVFQPQLLITTFYRRRFHGNNGTLVASSSAHSLNVLCRIVNVEIRHKV